MEAVQVSGSTEPRPEVEEDEEDEERSPADKYLPREKRRAASDTETVNGYQIYKVN